MSSTVKCKQITASGFRCSRNAVIDGYCTQHYNILIKKEEKEIIDNKYEQELPPDITQNILSEYVDYEDLENLNKSIKGFKINPKEKKSKNHFIRTEN